MYGGTEHGFVKDSDFISVSTSKKYWKEVIEKYYEKYSGIKQWHDKIVEQSYHRPIVSPFGREYVYSYKYSDATATVKNYIVQGLGADIVALIRVLLYKRLKGVEYVKMFNTVHDSIEIDCLSSKNEYVINCMEEVLAELNQEIYNRFGVVFNLNIQVEHDIREKAT